jgi:hypothetical protein
MFTLTIFETFETKTFNNKFEACKAFILCKEQSMLSEGVGEFERIMTEDEINEHFCKVFGS